MNPTRTVAAVDGVQIAVHDFGGQGHPLLIAHATGMCGAMYAALADELQGRFHVYALDFRGHGRSRCEADADLRWTMMASDLVRVTRSLSDDPIHVFGHSMGGAAVLLAQLVDPHLFRSAYLFEPIVYSRDALSTGPDNMAEVARNRRATFRSREEVLFRYSGRPPFDRLQAGCLLSYVENGFEECDNGVTLRCTPETEARVFEDSGAAELELIEHVTTPTLVAVGRDEPGVNPARFGPPLASALPNGDIIRYGHIGHFGPFQDPWTIARDMISFVENAADETAQA